MSMPRTLPKFVTKKRNDLWWHQIDSSVITWSPCYVIVLSRWRSASKIKTIKLTMELLAWVCHSDLLLARRWENQHLSDAPTVWTRIASHPFSEIPIPKLMWKSHGQSMRKQFFYWACRMCPGRPGHVFNRCRRPRSGRCKDEFYRA